MPIAKSLSEAALTFLASAVGCLMVGYFAIRWLTRAQCLAPVRYEDCPPLAAYQQTKKNVPTMGGIFALGVGILIASIMGVLSEREGWLVMGVIIGHGAIGLYDDVLKFQGANAVGLRAVPKLFCSLAIGAIFGTLMLARHYDYSIIKMPWSPGRSFELGWIWVVLSMVVVAGSAHAVNLTDGMDGLAGGCLAIALSLIGIWALVSGPQQRAVVIWCASLSGACVGFLWFNSFPASVFLGDVGSLGFGAALGAISLVGREPLWLLIIGGVFVIEAASVIMQVASYKWRNKRRIFRVAPLHHHFHLGGLSEPKLMVRFWILGLILALLGVVGMNME